MRETGHSRARQRTAWAATAVVALLTWPAGCRDEPDPGMHTSAPANGGEIHIRLREPIPEIGQGRDVWFTNVRLVLFTNEGALASLGDQTDRPPCYDPSGKAEKDIRVYWKDMKRIEWDQGRLATTLRMNGYRLFMYSLDPIQGNRTIRIRYERAVPVAGGYKVERTTKDCTFDLAKIERVEFEPR